MWLQSQRKRKRQKEGQRRLRRDRNQDGAYAQEKGQEEVTLEITNDNTTKTNPPAVHRSTLRP